MKLINNFTKHLIATFSFFILGCCINLSGHPQMTTERSNLEKLLQNMDIGDWTLTQENYYHRENLYDYIDGGAELFLSYGFQGLITRIYERQGQPDIIIDIFDMEKSQNAFGIFSHSREEISNEFGQGSQYSAGLLLFWKDRYYVSILASPESPESREAVFKIARFIEEHIKTEGELPTILNRLPQNKLISTSVRYFKHHAWQNSYYFISTDNIFNITENTNAILAKYQDLGILLIIEYQTGDDAKKALENFIRYYIPENPEGKIIQIEDGTWTGAKVSGNVLIAVFNAPQEKAVYDLLNAME